MISIETAMKDYAWGRSRFIAMHEIGDYTIVEFWREPASNEEDKNFYRCFGTYIGGKRAGNCYWTLDEALAGCIAIRHEGLNARADRYFMLMIGGASDKPRDVAPGNLGLVARKRA